MKCTHRVTCTKTGRSWLCIGETEARLAARDHGLTDYTIERITR